MALCYGRLGLDDDVCSSCEQAVDMKLLGSLSREDLMKICGDNFPQWISFPAFEQVLLFIFA